jgi:uncharacterized protein (TIGR02099 family)
MTGEAHAHLVERLADALPASRSSRRIARVLLWALGVVYFGFIVLVLALRYVILPQVADYRGDVERLLGGALGQAVSIGRIEATWDGINPDLTLYDVSIADAEGRPALAFSRAQAILSWWSVPSAQLKLRMLRIDNPTLNLRRDASGRFFIAGIPLSPDGREDSAFSDWVLAQRRIRVNDAVLVWQDGLRDAPALVLDDLDFALDNDGRHHRFGFTALPPAEFASKIDVRGVLEGRHLGKLETWSGQAYAEIAYADLAVWRHWIDYPVALPRGQGALRTWFSFSAGRLNEITADLALRDAQIRVAEKLPQLDLEAMSGRIGLRFSDKGLAVTGRRVELVTEAPRKGESGELLNIEPTDFQVYLERDAEGKPVAGNASVSALDLGRLAQIAAYLPLDEGAREFLSDYAPQGRFSGLTARWAGNSEQVHSFRLKTDFDDFALHAQDEIPGFSGLSGTIETTEKGGSVSLRSKKAMLAIPSVFPEPVIALDTLDADAKWTVSDGEVRAELARLEFSGPDAAGSARGSYRTNGSGPGIIDLTAALTRGDARAVWRYMPHAVGAGARQWLRESLISGTGSDAKLTLKGDLAYFPFLDKSKGQFLVTVKAHNAVLDYATGWPRIEGVDGELRFEGNGMIIEAQRGTMLGAKLLKTRAEIPDFDKPVSTLIVKGQAEGPTAEFLNFVEKSPVGERIDHVTADMRAAGPGHLDLALTIPLDEAKLGESKIDGRFRMTDNEVTVDPAMPALKQVNGSVAFSASDFRVPEVNATLLGGPLKLRGGSQKDGRVLITANGSINVAQMRKQFDTPLLDNFSGATNYQGEVRINKRDADLVIDSTLVGLASALPAPFNKPAGESLPLRFEKEFLPKGSDAEQRDRISAALGKVATLQLLRRKQSEGFVVERGALAIGRPLVLPESGMAVAVTAKSVDLDAWRKVSGLSADAASGKAATPAKPPSQLASVSIRTPDFVVSGRHLSDFDATVSPAGNSWKVAFSSTQASGSLVWESVAGGKLTARLKRLAVDAVTTPKPEVAAESIKELPALDVIADDFSIGTRRFGRLEVQARNGGGLWHLDKINTSNPFGGLSGSGVWKVADGKSETQLDFKVESGDTGKLLEQLGYPGAVRAGVTTLEGRVGWTGPPTDLDYDTLNGQMKLEAAKGQFVKLDPGAAGKLLGLISLQGLPRRISLDFKDVFSEGFAFDKITSSLEVNHGQMRTDRLQIDGPSARVVMSGEVDLRRETQHLFVNVQPELGGTAALGVALVSPVAGVATWFAHKLLQNPLNHMFGFNYLVTGTWEDPKVEKLAAAEATQDVPKLPTATTVPATPASPNALGSVK